MRLETIIHPSLRYFQTSWVGTCLIASLLTFGYLVCFSPFPVPEAYCTGLLATFLLFCSVSAYQLVRQRANLIFSPMPWFLLASGIYFGFGPLIYFYGNDMATLYCQQVWPVEINDLLRVTSVNILGVALVFAMWLWQTRSMPKVNNRPIEHSALVTAISAFYIFGFLPKCLKILDDCGLLSFTLPGFFGWLANLTSAGLVLLTTMALRRGGLWWLLWASLLALDVVGGVVIFSKMSILLAVVPCIFGYMLYRPKGHMIRWIPVFLAVVYLVSNSFVTFARNNASEHNSIWNRMNMAQTFLDNDEKNKLKDEEQAWWTRFNYANAQTFAMQDYERGTPGDSLMMALIAPIPRVLWPDKPFIESGRGFYKRLTGRDTASFGIGYLAEAYWNGGWVAVILCSCAIGWVFGKITVIINTEQAAGNLWVLPIALLWVRSGARVDGWIHTELVGPLVFTLICLGLMRYLLRTSDAPAKKPWRQNQVRTSASSRLP